MCGWQLRVRRRRRRSSHGARGKQRVVDVTDDSGEVERGRRPVFARSCFGHVKSGIYYCEWPSCVRVYVYVPLGSPFPSAYNESTFSPHSQRPPRLCLFVRLPILPTLVSHTADDKRMTASPCHAERGCHYRVFGEVRVRLPRTPPPEVFDPLFWMAAS